jgi:EPS-associated MarR family transcriptional regulator
MDESHFNILRELANDGMLSQRELSKRMGLSLGRVNSVVHALIKKRYITATRFKNSKNKIAYRYVMTPKGIRSQLSYTYGFLHKKQDEFERLKQEIKTLKREAFIADRRKNGRKERTGQEGKKRRGGSG